MARHKPCCGSGIFLITLIRKVVGATDVGELGEADRQTLIRQIVERIRGVDINPLSVLSARVSYFLALNQIGPVHDIEIPVYLGDSALVPTLENAKMRRADMIVGNPPWVKWEHLPAAYTRRIKTFCNVRHIFCNDGGMFGGAQLNICALISNVVASNWLKEDGCLAFLMPDSIMSQNSYEEFRNFYIDYAKREQLYLNRIDRWMPPLRPFKVGNKAVAQDFNTYYYSRRATDYRQGLPVRLIGKHRGTSEATLAACRTWDEARQLLTFGHGTARQLSAHSTAFTYTSDAFDFAPIIGPTAYLYRTGVESTPFEIFKLLGAGPSHKGTRNYRFRNKQLKTSRYKVEDIPPDGWDFDTRYIYPIVEGPCVKPFGYDTANNYHIIPYDEDNTQCPVPLAKLYAQSPSLATYFARHKALLDQQSEKSKTMHRGEEFYALSKIGPYTFAPHVVAARDNSRFCASVIRPTITPWGELKQSVCVKHTIIISQDTDGNFITANEAHYINGILNSTIVRAYIHSTFKTNGFSLKKSHLFLPKFSSDNATQRRIAALSRAATAHPERRQRIMEKLTHEYLSLCREENRVPQ